MSSINALTLRIAIAFNHGLLPMRNQNGQATSEYGVVILIAIALGTAVLMLFTGDAMKGPLTALLSKVLSTATGMVKAG